MANQGKYFVLFCTTTYASVDDAKLKAPHELAAHMTRSKELFAAGKVLMAGAFLDSCSEPLTTMAVFKSREDAEEYVKGDPFVLKGTVANWYVREWANILG